MPFSDNPGQNYWDNRLKITPEIKFPSEQSKSPPPSPQTMLMIICTNPCLILIFFSQHWTGGEGGDVYMGNLVNCDDHVLLYTGVPMNFGQDCSFVANKVVLQTRSCLANAKLCIIQKVGFLVEIGHHTFQRNICREIFSQLN